jgi:hypothetical protein
MEVVPIIFVCTINGSEAVEVGWRKEEDVEMSSSSRLCFWFPITLSTLFLFHRLHGDGGKAELCLVTGLCIVSRRRTIYVHML